MWHKEARVSVAHRFPDPRRARGNDRRTTSRGLEVRDAPSFLRRRKRERPRPPQKRDLVVLADTPKKPCPCPKVKRGGQPLEIRPIVPRTGDFEDGLGNRRLGKRTNH